MKSLYNSKYNFLLEELSEEKKIVLLPGAFNPPHKGYFDFINYYSNLAGNTGKVLVLLGANNTVADDSTLAPETIKMVLDIYAKEMGNVKVLACPKNPIDACKDVWNIVKSGILILGCSTNDVSNLTAVKEYIESKNSDIVIIDPLTTACDAAESVGSTINLKTFNQALNNKKQLFQFLPDNISDKDKMEIFKILNRKKSIV